MNTSVRSESIPIIGEQIAATLNDAHLALERFVEGAGDAKDLELCATYLHSVRGALQIAEIYGAGLLAEEMEATCGFLADPSGPDKLLDEGIEALSRAMVQLPAYVEQVIGGARDVPLVLLPLLNDLRAARTNPLLSESTLLLLKVQSPLPASDTAPAHQPSGEDLAGLIVKYRPQFQLGLLGWIKDSTSEVDLARMASVAERLEKAAAQPEVHQLWWVVGGVLEALTDSGLESSVALKRLIGQADREIKRLQEEGEAVYCEKPPTGLINNLLYYVARSRTTGPRGEAIRAAFNLSALVPGDEQVEQLRESLAAPSPKLMKTVADAIREDLAKTKDVLDIFVRTGMQDTSELKPHVALLGKISDTLGVLGLGALREIVRQRSEELKSIVAEDGEIDVSVMIGLAAALLEVEDRLDSDLAKLVPQDPEATEAPVDAEYEQVMQAVMRECIVNLARTKEVITEVLAQPDDLSILDGLDEHLGGINAGLGMLGKTRAAEVLNRVGAAVRKFVRPDHQFEEKIMNRLADAIVSLEYYMETMAAGRKEPGYMLDNAERCLEVIELAAPVPVQDTADSVEQMGTVQLDAPDIAAMESAEGKHDRTEIIEAPAFDAIAERPDPEILELFIEEAGEEITSIQRHYPVWAENTGDSEALLTLRRSFHTLKGSGRMVGAAVIGAFCWNIEDLLNRLINQTVEPSRAMTGFIGDVVNALPQLLEQFEAGANPPPNLVELIADADTFCDGEIPQRYAELNRDDAEAIEEPEFAEEAEVVVEPDQRSLDPVLLEILDKETAGHLEVLRKFVADHADAHEPVAVTEGLHRACHTLKGSMTMANAEEAVAVAAPMYEVIDAYYRRDTGLPEQIVALCNDSAAAIEQIMLYLANPAIDAPDYSQLIKRLLETVQSVGQETLVDPRSEQADTAPHEILEISSDDDADAEFDVDFDLELGLDSAEQDLLAPSELELTDGDTDTDAGIDAEDESQDFESVSEPPQAAGPEFDAEIAAIFAEEAAEILEAADSAMEQLADQASDPEPLAELQRHLHTLKGGARMAGVKTMGDFSHELESLLMRINQGGMGLDKAAYGLMLASFDELHRMHEQVMSGVVEPPGAELMNRLAMVVEATMMTPALVQEAASPAAEPAVPEPEAGQSETPEIELPELEAQESDAAESEVAGLEAADEVPDEAVTAEPEVTDDFVTADSATVAMPTVPEPKGLGELARELTQGKPPTEAGPLPGGLLPPLPTQAAVPEPAQQRRELLRVDAAMLEDLLNDAGEVSISHSRLNQQLSSIQFNLEELGTTVSRLQQQLRLLEIETEAQILFKHQSDAESAEDFDPLELDRYSTIQQLSRALVETANDVNSIKDLLRNLASDAETILLHQKRTTSAMQDSLMRTRMVPFDQHVPRLSRLVRQTAKESGKHVELVVEGSSGELDRQVMEKMLPPFEHMLRNSVIHGIETPDVRTEAGKPESGTIVIRFKRDGSEVVIEVSDDGAGLDLEAVRLKALERGLLEPDRNMTDEELAQLIFHSGLSTASHLTQSAGRGIGMDVVVSEVAKLGGRLTIQTETGQGCTFAVRLPYTLAVSQAFIVRAGKESFALPLATVEGISRIPHEQYTECMGQEAPVIEQRGQVYRLQHLGPYLGLGPAKFAPEQEQIPVILVRAGENSTALVVDETADHREIVVKPIGALLAGIRGIAGATILGDGGIVVILDAGALVRDARPLEKSAIGAGEIVEDLAPLALVVDDSITMRRVTQRLLERNGLRVVTAKDGVDALEVLQEKMPDIIVLDIEMPRMDGYEFAGHVRNTPATENLPIIMVTSRVGEKHRARAIEIGVNDYLGKPYQEHEMLDAIRNLLGDVFGSDAEPETLDSSVFD